MTERIFKSKNSTRLSKNQIQAFLMSVFTEQEMTELILCLSANLKSLAMAGDIKAFEFRSREEALESLGGILGKLLTGCPNDLELSLKKWLGSMGIEIETKFTPVKSPAKKSLKSSKNKATTAH